ncbi:hypothetical protein QYF61_023540 [Mycteria americana]|uniref:Uncharacterized protein n=1 Tax=Mycteria americana TaxID=33587 RepID=A0AAN7PWD8_MYCAM|nr:hypothetical protein QYF61_023540 [Mycteria americana]
MDSPALDNFKIQLGRNWRRKWNTLLSNLEMLPYLGGPLKDILDRLAGQASRNLMKLNKDKCKVPHLGRMSPCNNTGWALLAWKAALKEKPWGSSWEAKLSMGPQGHQQQKGQQHPDL